MKAIYNKILVLAYDQDGEELPDQHQYIHNTIWPEISAEPVITIQYDQLPVDQEGAEVVQAPLTIKGKTYRGDLVWGSGVKMGRSIGLTNDLPVESGLIRFAEDVYRFKRAFLPNGQAAGRGPLWVKMLPVGTVVDGLKIEDGFGYIRQSIALNIQGKREKLAKIKFGGWDTSYTYLQRFEMTPEFWAEIKPHLDEAIINLNDPANFAFSHLCDSKEKNDFMRLAWEQEDHSTYDDLAKHPYLAKSFVEAWARATFRVSVSAGTSMQGGLFVPTPSDKLVLSDRFSQDTHYIITRYPIDSPSSIRLVEVEQNTAEAARIGELEAVQYTLTTSNLVHSFKGMLGIIPDQDWPFGECGMVTSTEDEKLNAGWLTEEDVNQAKETERGYVFEDAILVFTQWYGAGSCIGVPSALAKKLGGDYDGDAGAVEPASRFPERARQAGLFPEIANPKLPKTKTPIRPEKTRAMTLLKSMSNLVGHATNVYSTLLAYPDQEFIARELGYADASTLHRLLEYAIKVGTDLFKSSVDFKPVERMLGTVSKGLREMGVRAPWTHWAGDEVAFHHNIPPVFEVVPEEMDEWERANYIGPDTFGPVATIARYVLPQVDMMAQTPIMPLVYFRDWARPPVNKAYHQSAVELHVRFGRRVASVNMQSNEAFANFLAMWQALVAQEIRVKKFDAYLFAQALWFVTHTDQRHSQLSKIAAAPFWALPEEVKRLVVEKPGQAVSSDGIPVISVVGLAYQWPAAAHHQGETFTVEVKDFVQSKGTSQVVRQCLIGSDEFNNLQAPKDPQYPQGMLALTALNMPHIKPGSYRASFTLDNKDWRVSLEHIT